MILAATADVAPLPWKNGGGVTRDLLRLPAGSGDDWTLRISVADIDVDGAFSAFPGVVRWFAAVAGTGVRLRWPTRARDVRPGDAPLRFDGADPPDCTLLDGPTRDLNVMVRAGRADVHLGGARFDVAAPPASPAGFGLFALQPLVLHGAGAAPQPLAALTLAWCEPPVDGTRAWSIAPSDGGPASPRALPGWWIRLLPPAP